MDEKIFFNQENVSVSNSRFIVNDQTYAMSNVTSVKSGITEPQRGGSIFLIVIGLLCLFGSGWVFGLGCILIVLGISAWLGAKTQYSVILNTSAGENQALVSEEKAYIEDVITALNDAIVSRG
ncbi:DUF6232 family protein [Iodobacter ciconiae]|uniref:QacE n=1 Tax=Iodobacter ciconiae TaxID=2496266 RepID=A0A3S8ZNJ1_9NEIS|nr:DUF6232 family protein [Iodobacter ciconiae]AZN35133.1 QacE [Iodobacter ciconiae]